jgi:hypothetical protein
VSKASIKIKRLVSAINTNARLGVFSNAFFKEVCFALEADCFHPFKWVLNFEVTVATEAEEQLVSAEFDVVTHHCRVHSNQFNGTTNSISIATALLIISTIRDSGSRLTSFE